MKDLGKKKLLMIAAGIIAFVILIIIILLIYNAVFVKTSYKDIENKVVKAAQKYYGDHKELLPKNETEEVSTTDTALTAAGYLDSMSKLTKKMKGVSCSATVIVSYAGGEYRYTPLLNCGSNYSSKTLTTYIKENEPTVFNGQGLYQLNGDLVFRGENPNNYVSFAKKMWRIVKIENDQVVLILNEKFQRNVWDDRFNSDRDRTDGINDYNVSRIKDTLIEAYQGEELFTKESKNLVAVHNLKIGKRHEADSYNDGSIEKSAILENQYIGVLPLYDYINGSIDENCSSTLTDSCSNYNYLNHYDYDWWTITADSSTTHRVFRISSYGTLEAIRASSNGYIRPVIYLAKDALYVNGTGTETDPYTIK